jgi:vancomycin resistance protein VanJ
LPPPAVWLVGQVVRDRSWLTGMCFYLPSPLVAAWLLLLALGAGWQGRRRRALGVAGVENQWTPPARSAAPAGPPLRLVHWNVWDGPHMGHRWPRICRVLTQLEADVYVLSEAPDEEVLSLLVHDLCGGFAVCRYRDMAVLARGELLAHAKLADGPARAHSLTWRPGGAELALLVVDLPSNLRLARDPYLRWVRGLVADRQPDLVVGDFNAPRRSAALADLPAGYRHAYDAAGAGWSYTYPVPAPLWAIDQCLVGPRLVPLRHELHATADSDHRLQVLDFAPAAP